MRVVLAVAALLAAVWVVLPSWTADRPAFVRASPTPSAAPAPPELRGRVTGPVRYAYRPECDEEVPACERWVLVSARGERWLLPDALSEDVLALSRDGTRAAYPHRKTGRLVVADLAAGTARTYPVRPSFPAPEFSPDGRRLLVPGDHPVVVDVDRGTVRRTPGGPEPVPPPGHVTTTTYLAYAEGGAIRRVTLPGNLVGKLSPSGRLLATVPREVTPEEVVTPGVLLVDAATGRSLRTIPGPVQEVVRWESESALIVRKDGYQVLDVNTGGLRPLGIDGDGVVVGAVG
ncbi:hypothetical protein [Nonomuraea sediminis]|uniref:hypothetical protein n=1 Tax=Nonomuraea sediminis TaxID=2835864 RepID=UPI001BDD4315|nr:hypothetical protein [Nonomuraea sediminis]